MAAMDTGRLGLESLAIVRAQVYRLLRGARSVQLTSIGTRCDPNSLRASWSTVGVTAEQYLSVTRTLQQSYTASPADPKHFWTSCHE